MASKSANRPKGPCRAFEAPLWVIISLMRFTMRSMMLRVLSSAMLQFCRPYNALAQICGVKSRPESTMATRRDSTTWSKLQTSATELSMRCRPKRQLPIDDASTSSAAANFTLNAAASCRTSWDELSKPCKPNMPAPMWRMENVSVDRINFSTNAPHSCRTSSWSELIDCRPYKA